MDILSLLFDPVVIVILIFAIIYGILVFLVWTTGNPRGMRGWPLCKRFFPVKIRVWETRSNGFFPVDDRGRRFKQKSGKELYQTIKYGDIMPPKLSSINLAAFGNIIEFEMTEDGEFFRDQRHRSLGIIGSPILGWVNAYYGVCHPPPPVEIGTADATVYDQEEGIGPANLCSWAYGWLILGTGSDCGAYSGSGSRGPSGDWRQRRCSRGL